MTAGFAYSASETATPSPSALIQRVGAEWAAARTTDAVATYRQILDRVPSLTAARDNLIVTMDLDPATTGAQAADARREWWQREGIPRYLRRQPHTNDPDPDRPLRVGYVSGDFRGHSAARCFAPILQGHTAAVVPYCYSTTDPTAYDAVTMALMAATTFRDVLMWSEGDLEAQIRADGIDVLVDLSGYSAGHRLAVFCRKPAPVQVSGWGYATSLGLDAIDAVLADRTVAYGSDVYTERVIELPSILHYAGPVDGPDVSPLPCLTHPPTFAAFHRPQKLNDAVLTVWRAILDRVPGSGIQFKGPGYDHPRVRAWIQGYFGDRAGFIGQSSYLHHLAAYQDVDLTLDPWPQTGGITTCEGLWMGVPPVTLLGPRTVQRISASLLLNVGQHGFIATTPDDYVDKAVAWVTTRRDGLQILRRDLRTALQTSPIGIGYVAAVETAYRSLWRDWCATRPA